MKKVLICSPVRGGCSPSYIKFLMTLHFSKMNKIMGGPNAPLDIRWAATSGTSVNLARDELANLAIEGGFDEMVPWDIDLGAFDSMMMLSMFDRLMSHNVDGIVAAQYVGHNFRSTFHGATIDNSPGPDSGGLLEMTQMPIGFSRIPIKCLKQIRDAFPHRTYAIKESVGQAAKANMYEYFPIGVTGPCSSEGKLERLKDLVKDEKPNVACFDRMEEIRGVLYDNRYETNALLGEDYYFCRLARSAGVKLYIDNSLIIPHETNVRLPVKNQDLLAAISEDWRLHNDAKPEQVRELVAQLAPLLSTDIP